MPNLLAPLVGGIAGTLVMTTVLLLPRWMNVAHVDVIRAVGALIMRKVDGAFMPGLVAHFASGILFAYVYQFILAAAKIPLNFSNGLFIGGVHGAIVMLVVSIAIMEHHPIAKYHRRGPMTGIMQLIAHIVYGGTVGLVVQAVSNPAA